CRSRRSGVDRRRARAGCCAARRALDARPGGGCTLRLGPLGRRDPRALPRCRQMSEPFVVIDADVLGRRRTGDESYISALLGELVWLDHGLRLAAVTRRPDLVPEGVEAVTLGARNQILRMGVRMP